MDEINRGDYLSNDESLQIKNELELDFTQNPFYKGEITPNQMCLVSVGLQIKSAKFISVDPLKISLDKPLVCKQSEICVILKPESQSVRILGSGKIK